MAQDDLGLSRIVGVVYGDTDDSVRDVQRCNVHAAYNHFVAVHEKELV